MQFKNYPKWAFLKENIMADEVIAPQAVEQVETPETAQETPVTADVSAGQAPAAELTKAEIKKLNKLMLKVDGEEFEESLPFDLEDRPEVVEYLKKHLQLSKVSQKRMAHSSNLEKEIGAFLTELRENPEGVLGDPSMGVDLEALVKRHVERKIEESKKTPEQIAQEKVQDELKRLKQELNDRDEKLKAQERTVLEEKLFNEYNTSIESALKEANLPVNDYMKGRVADYMHVAVKNGIDAKPAQVLVKVQEDIQNELTKMFSVMPAEVIKKFVGEEALKKFNKSAPKKPITTPASATKVQDNGGKKEEAEKKADKQALNKFPLFRGMGF